MELQIIWLIKVLEKLDLTKLTSNRWDEASIMIMIKDEVREKLPSPPKSDQTQPF